MNAEQIVKREQHTNRLEEAKIFSSTLTYTTRLHRKSIEIHTHKNNKYRKGKELELLAKNHYRREVRLWTILNVAVWKIDHDSTGSRVAVTKFLVKVKAPLPVGGKFVFVGISVLTHESCVTVSCGQCVINGTVFKRSVQDCWKPQWAVKFVTIFTVKTSAIFTIS